ncbi:hypothetical protein IV498_09280 [Paenarthrobacter sp. Z7-10]|uniref:hypothetical protein n=1 Tax=Paenarthrobacter sp. Z7-10 TaxID=2787635 RepID=UPI0022A98609|nr:hypothetical protein [Paenarthrobacter sp. Z7-10]MCZ2403368.1 hypothetical protein [Paenarthrobacter sp. Z7-10]
MRIDYSALALSALLSASTIKHLRDPKFYYPVIPRSLCTDTNGGFGVMSRQEWVSSSAVLEAAAAVGLLLPGTRKAAATATALMFAGFTAGHIFALRRAFGPSGTRRGQVVHSLRLPLQLPLVLWAWSLRRR